MSGIMRNAEGYYDPTAGAAIHNIISAERKKKRMEIKRGDIYYIDRIAGASIGSEQQAGRPAIIVSNNVLNETSEVVEVVYLTTQDKGDKPTHVQIRSTGRISTALCEQISTASILRVGARIGTATKEEMLRIDTAIMISLGIEIPKSESFDSLLKESKVELMPCVEVDAEKVELKAQLEVYKNLYADLLQRVMKGDAR